MSNVIKFPNIEEPNLELVETDRLRIRDTIYQIPIKVKFPLTADYKKDAKVYRQIFVELCEHYGFGRIDIDRDHDSNATACLLYINGFFLPHGVVKRAGNTFNFKCNYDVYTILLESMAYEYGWPVANSIEEERGDSSE